jgi:threonine synthase
VAGEIRARYEQDGYLCDTHTAVAFHVAGRHKREGVPMVVLSTASPYKFPRSVLEALGHTAPQNDFEAMQELEAATGRTAPASLAALRQKAERFNTVIDPEQIAQVALSYQE